MGTKVKGFFKGFKNISNIFDDDEEPEIQIGMPTDVKHIAHIGADGPATESPSWMKGYDSGQSHSGSMEGPDMKRGNKNHRSTRSEELTRDLSDVPKTTRHRHHRSMDNSMDPDSQSSAKPKHRRHRRIIRRSHEKGELPDIPKRTRRRRPIKDDEGSR
ncbi:putative CRIB domain-containing protein [Helianthus annuus]|uniref:CRIB domain-containing protein n=1 Tax=Helianthus annuus TaxID=4232 RepID=A0A251UGQ1_HELAN|nr:CRIB domain-containing protein RIC1 [Helianthus annuus]KAF5801601.1 putative CRIB domain-containing protein [Helianthus annuus]KAJ0559884.1 putative CRIB domain-containing protein RIC1 [Helianthus annuus]KAJ0566014.1 putative CRIB domain-containing protein [Helianthus annuus]KAJ0572873.1 putative CRIB domain-containing protein RIC1 [Helianthus annuus]KAJ0737306.1 putative CRIB domain-containing protein RIC1 [Helianthus annuus]